MLTEQHLVALLVKIAVAASLASILMRFRRIRQMLLRDDRSIHERLELAAAFSLIFGIGEMVRLIAPDQYQAIDLAFESAFIAGLLAGYVSGLVAGICVSVPAMFGGEYMSMPLYAAAGVMGGLMRDLSPDKEDVWYFSAFVDQNLYRLLRELIWKRRARLEKRAVERSTFLLTCNLAICLIELFRLAISLHFPQRAAFSIAKGWSGSLVGHYIVLCITTSFSIALPIRIWASARAEEQLEQQQRRLVEARLAALTNQINPHFLFNTLNSIATLVRIDPDRARGVIYKLSNILRRLLRNTDSLTALRDEIRFIDDYLAIEMVRFGSKLRFEKDIREDTLNRFIPSMILQPIIENSIKHGLSSKVDGGLIRLRTWLDGRFLYIAVEDDGVGIESDRLASILGSGIGVSNVYERLKVMFDSNFEMKVDSTPGSGTRTTIRIPEVITPESHDSPKEAVRGTSGRV